MENKIIESAVLGCMILDDKIFESVINKYTDDYFHTLIAKRLFNRLRELHKINTQIDTTMILANLKDDIELKNFVVECVDSVSSVDMFEFYIGQLKELKVRRDIKAIGVEMQNSDEVDLTALLSLVETKLNTVKPEEEQDERAELEEIVNEFNDMRKRGDEMTSGFPRLDDLIGGFRRTRVYVIGGYSGHGKTGISLYLAQRIAFVQNMKVLYFSMEMSKKEIIGRLSSLLSGIPAWKTQKDKYLTDEDIVKIQATCGKVYKTNFKLEEGTKKIGEIIQTIKQVKPDFVVIDHIQYMAKEEGFEKEHESINFCMKQLKTIAKKENIAIMVLSQNKTKQPGESVTFKGSSGIKEAADVGMIISFDEKKKDTYANKPDGLCTLSVMKNRHGRRGFVELLLDTETLKYGEYAFQKED